MAVHPSLATFSEGGSSTKRAVAAMMVVAIAAALFSASFGTVETNVPPVVLPVTRQPTKPVTGTDELPVVATTTKRVPTPVKPSTAVTFETVPAADSPSSVRTLEEGTFFNTLIALANAAVKGRSDSVHCPANFWMNTPLEEQARIAPLFTLSPKYKSSRSKVFKPKKRVAVILVGEFEEPASSRIRKRATAWAAQFDKAYLVGADSSPVKHMACNRNSFPHLIACAAHIMVTEGGNFASVTILDATTKDYDKVACALAKTVSGFEANIDGGFDEKKPLKGRIVLDTEPLEAMNPADACLRNRFVSQLFAHVATADVVKHWPKLVPPQEGDARLQLHWYTHRHRLKAFTVPSAAFFSFFKMASEFLLTDTPVDVGIVPFAELLAIAAGSGDGIDTPQVTLHRLRSSFVVGEAKAASPRSIATFEPLAGVPPPMKSIYGKPIFSAPIEEACKADGAANIDEMEPTGSGKSFPMFSKLPIGSWVVPYNVRKGSASVADVTVHSDVSGSSNDELRTDEGSDPSSTFLTVAKRSPSRFSVRLKVKGVGPVSPASPQVPRTMDFIDHDQPPQWSQMNFYPPAIVISMKFNEILDRDFVRNYFKTLEKHFRRVVIVSKDPAKGVNDMHAPFPRYCLDGLSTTACMIHLLRKRFLRRSGGLMFLHIDAFIFPLEHFGDGRTRDMLISKRHQYFGGAPDDWPLWPDPYKTDYAGLAGEPMFAHWNRGVQVFSSFFHEWRDQNPMLRNAQEMRQNTFADIFYVPSRAFDMAVDILDYHFPSMTPFEGFIGYWASVITSATTTRYNGFEYQGCCCCGSDGEVLTHPAGHKVTPSNQQTVNNMAKRIADSFDCSVTSDAIAIASPMTNLGPLQHLWEHRAMKRFFEDHRDEEIHTVLEEQTCKVEARVQVSSKHANVNVFIVAPLTNVVQVKVTCSSKHSQIQVFAHTPNVNSITVEVDSSCVEAKAKVRLAVVTGVTQPTKVMVNEKSQAGFVLDEADDVVVVSSSPSSPTKLQVDIDTSSHFKSEVNVMTADAASQVAKG